MGTTNATKKKLTKWNKEINKKKKKEINKVEQGTIQEIDSASIENEIKKDRDGYNVSTKTQTIS
jgi:hypothetical protein